MAISNRLYLLDVSVLEQEKNFKHWYSLMDQSRKNKIDAIKPQNGKLLSLGAGILLKKALENEGITDFELCYKGREKPYIKDREDVFFNISHSGKMVALGISDKEIGVDIEKVKEFKESLINYVFNDTDISFAKELSPKWAYTRLWTIKESLMKHSGLGIALVPKKIEIYAQDENIRTRAEQYPCHGLNFTSYTAGDYQVSVCSEYPEGSFVLEYIQI